LNLDKCLKTSQEDYRDLTSKYAPKRGDIVFTRNASFGVACYVETDREFCIGQDVVVMTSDKYSTKFLFYVLNSDFMNAQVNRLSTGSTFKRINLYLIRKLKFALPPYPEQKRISEILSTVDSKLHVEKQEKTRLEKTMQGLMDLLLTGKVRVRVD
jgi:type I restriction enzyme S subunit